MDGLAESQFDAESIPVKQVNLPGIECQVGAQQEDGAAQRMAHDDETDQPGDRSPHQVPASIVQHEIVFFVDEVGRGGTCGIVLGQILAADLVAVEPQSSPLPLARVTNSCPSASN